MVYGSVEIRYRGKHSAIFGLTAVGAGSGAVMGFVKGGPLLAFIGMIIGGTLGLLAGYFLEAVIEELGRTFTNTTARYARKSITAMYR